MRLLWQFRSRVSSRVVCVSEAVREQMIRTIGVPPRKVVAVRNGIDAERFRPDEERRTVVRRAWGVPDDALVFGAVCRQSPEKGLDTAIVLFGAPDGHAAGPGPSPGAGRRRAGTGKPAKGDP